jgi:hypothetical protein
MLDSTTEAKEAYIGLKSDDLSDPKIVSDRISKGDKKLKARIENWNTIKSGQYWNNLYDDNVGEFFVTIRVHQASNQPDCIAS